MRGRDEGLGGSDPGTASRPGFGVLVPGLILAAAAAGCSIDATEQDPMTGFFNGTYRCGEVNGPMFLSVTGSGSSVTGTASLRLPEDSAPVPGTAFYTLNGERTSEFSLRLAGAQNAPRQHDLPPEIELSVTGEAGGARLTGQIEPCGGTFTVGRSVFTGFK